MAAGVIMSGLMLATGRGLPKPRLWAPLALLGFLMNIVGNGFVVYAQQFVASGLTAVLIATTPFWSALIERLLPNGERFSKRSLAGLGSRLLRHRRSGVARDDHGGASGRSFVIGVIAIQLACVGWVIGTSFAKRHELGDNPFRSTALQMVFSGIMLLAAATAHGDWAHLSFTPAHDRGDGLPERRRIADRVLGIHLRDPASAAAAGVALRVHQSDDRGGAGDAAAERAALGAHLVAAALVFAGTWIVGKRRSSDRGARTSDAGISSLIRDSVVSAGSRPRRASLFPAAMRTQLRPSSFARYSA